MKKRMIDLSTQQAVFAAALTYMQDRWTDRFATHKKAYDAAHKSISDRLSDAGKSKDKALIAMVTKIADAALKPVGIYGAIATVALAGFSEIAKGGVTSSPAVKLKAPSATSFSADLEKLGVAMFEPLKAMSYFWAKEVLTKRYMDAEQFAVSKSDMLASPIWYPPPELTDAVALRRVEEVLWCAYFVGLAEDGYESYQLRFLDEIVSYLIKGGFVERSDSAGWSAFPKPISQGGPGDWTTFLRETDRFWKHKLYERVDQGWLTPMPVIPKHAKVEKSVNWTPPKTFVYNAPTKSGKASITIEFVEMTKHKMLDWGDIPALPQNKK